MHTARAAKKGEVMLSRSGCQPCEEARTVDAVQSSAVRCGHGGGGGDTPIRGHWRCVRDGVRGEECRGIGHVSNMRPFLRIFARPPPSREWARDRRCHSIGTLSAMRGVCLLSGTFYLLPILEMWRRPRDNPLFNVCVPYTRSTTRAPPRCRRTMRGRSLYVGSERMVSLCVSFTLLSVL